MKRLFRCSLPPGPQKYLEQARSKLSLATSSSPTAEVLWKSRRASKPMQQVERILADMAGPRERCFFCCDSRATDIEHFWPKSLYPELTFFWPNLLLACTGCNRAKGNSFPLDEQKRPLLIDPTAEDPWDYLYFDSATHRLTARWQPAGSEGSCENPRGKETLRVLRPLNHEAVENGRRQTLRELRKTVQHLFTVLNSAPEEEALRNAIGEAGEILGRNDYGLAEWFLEREGIEEPPFSTLREGFPAAWEALLGSCGRSRRRSSAQ